MQDKINIINFGFNPWSDFWKRNQTVVYLLSQYPKIGKVLFVNNEVWLADAIKKPHKQFVQPLRNNWKYVFNKKVTSKIWSYTPAYLPFNNKIDTVSHINQLIITKTINQYLDQPTILVINNPHWTTRRLIEQVHKHSTLSIFDWSDDFKEFSSNPYERERTDSICRDYCKMTDIVTTVNDRLSQQGKRWNPNTHTIRNATNYFTFKAEYKKRTQIRMDLPKDRPIVGYIGYMNRLRLDLELINYIVEQRPQYTFVFMGPKCEELPLGRELTKRNNVFMFDAVPYEEYIRCLAEFDVCILPNRVNPNTDGNDPIKLYDYLASGKQVVCTPTSGVEQFKDVVNCGKTNDEFLLCLDMAVKDRQSGAQQRIRIAEKNSWQERIKSFADIIEIELNKKCGRGLNN